MIDHATYTTAQAKGRPAEARVRGVLRGGFVLDDEFWTVTGQGRLRVPLADVTDLRYHDNTEK